MCACCFNDCNEKMGVGFKRVDERIDTLTERFDRLTERVCGVETEVTTLRNSVNNYLELSDKRYLELRETNRLIFKYLKIVIEKTKVSINLNELEKLVK